MRKQDEVTLAARERPMRTQCLRHWWRFL